MKIIIKKIVVSVLFVIALLTSLHACRFVKAPAPVADAIQKYINQTGKSNELIELKLSDFTSFEWERVLIFNYPTSKREIEEALGVSYDGGTDLVSGMVFVDKNEIVHYEYFDYNYMDLGKFMVYSQPQIGAEPGYRVFFLDEAVFNGKKVVRNDTSFIYYRLYPVSWSDSNTRAGIS